MERAEHPVLARQQIGIQKGPSQSRSPPSGHGDRAFPASDRDRRLEVASDRALIAPSVLLCKDGARPEVLGIWAVFQG